MIYVAETVKLFWIILFWFFIVVCNKSSLPSKQNNSSMNCYCSLSRCTSLVHESAQSSQPSNVQFVLLNNGSMVRILHFPPTKYDFSPTCFIIPKKERLWKYFVITDHTTITVKIFQNSEEIEIYLTRVGLDFVTIKNRILKLNY